MRHVPAAIVAAFAPSAPPASRNGGSGKTMGGQLCRLFFLFLVVACAGMLPDRAFALTLFSGSLNASSPTMSGRIFRNSVSSTCAAIKSFPGDIASPNTQYQTASYTHTGPAGCVTFTYMGGTCGTNGALAYVSIYSGPFDPANRATNFLGDIGASEVGRSAGVSLLAGQTVTLVVNGVTSGLDCNFTVDTDDPSLVFAGNLGPASLTMPGRIFRNSVPSACAAVKTYPGDVASLNTQYQTASYTHTGPAGCVAFTYSGGSCGTTGNSAFLSIYGGPFDPVNRAANYLGDAGSSVFGQSARVFLTAGQTVTLVVNGIVPGLNCAFSVNADLLNVPAGKNDFNGNRKSDILWRLATTGEIYFWLMDGMTFSSHGTPGAVDLNWQVVATGDFDGDGKADLFWRYVNGMTYVWLMNGLTIGSSGSPGTVGDPNWQVEGSGDFDGDLKSDILWRNVVTGDLYIWLMTGLGINGHGSPGAVADLNWKVQAIGDFDRDGKADILWRNVATGDVAIWLMDGMVMGSGGGLGIVPLAWNVQGTGDFDGNGKTDIFWRNAATGDTSIWLMNGMAIGSSGSPGAVDLSWQAQGVADYDGSGKADILWRNIVSGQLYLWMMNGLVIGSHGPAPLVSDLNWQIQNPK